MKPEHENLIGDLLNKDSLRENTLLAGAGVLRRRRQWRAVRQSVVVLAIIGGLTALWLKRETLRPLPAQIALIPQPAQVHSLTDDELLGLFTNTPVGLASLPDGKKRLIFPRAGDERRFITRL